jgi:hypothetical protein
MHFVTRQFVCDRLKISRKTAYLMFPTRSRAPLQDTQVVKLLNAKAVGISPVTMIPSNLLTLNEAQAQVTVDNWPITRKRFDRWMEKRVIPHYRLTSHTVRIPSDLFTNWLLENL